MVEKKLKVMMRTILTIPTFSAKQHVRATDPNRRTHHSGTETLESMSVIIRDGNLGVIVKVERCEHASLALYWLEGSD